MAYKLATEDYAYNIGLTGTPVTYKFCTKTRALELGCAVVDGYSDNQWVNEVDLSKAIPEDALYIRAYYDLKIAIIYDPADSDSTTSTTLEYSSDYSTWTLFTMSTDGSSYITLTKGNKIYLRGNNPSGFSSCLNFVTILINPSGIVSADIEGASVGGDLRYLLSYDKSISTIPNDYCFGFLFENSEALTYANDLILGFSTMSNFCYAAMFRGCSVLRGIPSLYATTLTMGCYYHMYHDCIKLSSVASDYFTSHIGRTETCAANCYEGMFHGCESLVNPPDLLSTSLSPCCYRGMYNGCISLIRTGSLPATVIPAMCYESMYENCTSLTHVPAILPGSSVDSTYVDCINATDIDSFKSSDNGTISATGALSAYADMFKSCTSLLYAPGVAFSGFSADNSATMCAGMFNGCSSLKQLAYNWTWNFGMGTAFCLNWVTDTPDSGVTYYGGTCSNVLKGNNSVKSGWTRGGAYTSMPTNSTYQDL